MHFVAMLFSVAALVLLIVFSVSKGTAWHIVSFSIFGSSAILLYFASSLYHFTSQESRFKDKLRKFDHIMIYILIAGTYTPISLVALRGGWGWSVFGVIWGLALIGILLKFTRIQLQGWKSVLFYIFMGWLILIALFPLIKIISFQGFFLLFLGGLLYTLGTIFFGLGKIMPQTRWFGMHDVFHLFVMAGSLSHFLLMFKHILYL